MLLLLQERVGRIPIDRLAGPDAHSRPADSRVCRPCALPPRFVPFVSAALELVDAVKDLVMRSEQVGQQQGRESVIERQRRLVSRSHNASSHAERELLSVNVVWLVRFCAGDELSQVTYDGTQDLRDMGSLVSFRIANGRGLTHLEVHRR